MTAIGDNNDLIFMMDAFDVWLQQSPLALVRRYEEMADGGVVVGADKGCWPNEWHAVRLRCLHRILHYSD
jgi:hypothetical protein